jgi:hypothetical protein
MFDKVLYEIDSNDMPWYLLVTFFT